VLVLARKPSERIVIGDSVVVTVVRVDDRSVRVGVEAPRDVPVVRQELLGGAGVARRPRTSPSAARRAGPPR
jgi:carbon storage regulator